MVLNSSPVVIALCISSFAVLPVPIRWKSTLRALPNITLVAEPMNTSPSAPTKSGESLVDMVRVVSTVRFQEYELSDSILTLAPTVKSFFASTLVITATPIPFDVSTFLPSLVVVVRPVSLLKFAVTTFDKVTIEPELHSADEPEPAGSRRIISIISGPEVTKLLPVGREPNTTPVIPLSLHSYVRELTSYVIEMVRV